MAEKPYVIHFISNTHWDREWLMNFQETRAMLVDFFDRLLEVMEQHAAYRCYVLDSQAVPLEDYLDVRPENRDRLAKLIAAGRLLVGPWYTAPEGFCVNGESLVRNLVYGHRVAGAFGKVMKVGHTSFGYGQNSQMPQIYAGFGIDTLLFYHGVTHDEVPNEFIVEGADGTRALGSQMSRFARYNAYHHLYRGALYGDRVDDRTYEWRRGGLPFRLCSAEPGLRHHRLLDVQKGWHRDLLLESLDWLREQEIAASTTRHLAFMMGHDSSVPDSLELRIIEETRARFPEDEVRHANYEEMMEAIKAEVDWEKLDVLRGERRTPKLMPVTMHLYSDVLSSRSRMKQLNTRAEYLLQRRAEPFACLAAQLGAAYPAGLLDVAWKTLLRCHAHDSIAGSGVDDIELDMTYRLRQVVNIANSLLHNALGAIQRRIDTRDAAPDDVLITVYNALAQPRSEVVSAVIDLPYAGPLGEFDLIDITTGKRAPVQVCDRKPHNAVVNHAEDAPANMKTEQFTVHLAASEIPAMGYATFKVDRTARFSRGGLVTAANTMENAFLCVRVNTDGTLCLMHKETGAVYDDLNYFVDNGEAGHAWMHHNPARDQAIDSRGFPVSIALEEDGALLARYRIACAMKIPARLEENGGDSWQRLDGIGSASSRSADLCDLVITSHVTLRRDARSVEIRTEFHNTATHHRLRAFFPTRRAGTTCHAESAFDVVERETAFSAASPWHGTKGVTFPQQRFVDVTDGSVGLAVLNDGLREYEVTQDADRAIAITLMRAFGVALCPVSMCWEELPEMHLAQAPGDHAFTYRLYPHVGDYVKGGVFAEAEVFTVPLEAAQAGPHAGDLPPKHGFFDVTPPDLVLSAFKRAEDGQGYVLRLFNPTRESIQGKLSFAAPPVSAELVTLEERPVRALSVEKRRISIEAGPKKILTVKLVWG